MKHEMIGYEDGDWIKFLCPDCDRQRWIKRKEDGTVEMRSWGGDPDILHCGSMGMKTKNFGVEVSQVEKVSPEAKGWIAGKGGNDERH